MSRRVTAIMLMMVSGLWSGAVGYAQRVVASTTEHERGAQRITVDVDNAPLAVVLTTMARQAGLMPAFRTEILPMAKRVTLHLHDVPVSNAFAQALRGTGLTASVHAEGDVTIFRTTGAVSVEGSIIGRVRSATTEVFVFHTSP